MSIRNWLRANQEKLKQTKGAEDIAGRRLPGDVYDLPGMSRPFKPRPSKQELRDLANKAIADWNGRAVHSGLTAASS
ncbi:hypothetical protein [Bradyrhizobium sp. SZCCHNS1054]|uniref:hypothetical protein n=1 Tax=Bradyrhizobium sp. SZCCHNS1054 TaxID=3057301 RepID=UPI002916130E|nr:hypothetical protein [Bradyrhizobium sp. SZCCHNS1054]